MAEQRPLSPRYSASPDSLQVTRGIVDHVLCLLTLIQKVATLRSGRFGHIGNASIRLYTDPMRQFNSTKNVASGE